MTDQQKTYLINEPAGYRALFNGCQDAILVAPTGDIMATFTAIEDAMHTADVLNREHQNADALAKSATKLHHLRHQLDTLVCDALETINAAPARMVIKAATNGVGK